MATVTENWSESEIRVVLVVLFLHNKDNSPMKLYNGLYVIYDKDVMTKEWSSNFKTGRVLPDDENGSGPPYSALKESFANVDLCSQLKGALR